MNEDCFHLGIKALIRNKGGKLLLLRVNAKELWSYAGKPHWDLPGGRIHKGGTVEETLKREIEEETGIITLASYAPFSMVLSPIRIPLKSGDTVGLILAVYVCDIGTTETVRISSEHAQAAWHDPQKAGKLLAVKYPKEFTEKVSALE